MNKTTKILLDEHQNILKVADALERECNALKSGKKVDEKFLLEIIDFVRNYADKFHHAKEEDILFKEFCKNEGELHCNPIEQMLYEHNLGRDFIGGIEEGMKKRDKKMIVENALGYVHLIREHISKEDNILYPMAESAINEKTTKEMLKKYEKIVRERKKEIEKYTKFVKSLK